MLIHPWDAPQDDSVWRQWLSRHDFGQLAVNGPSGEPPFVQPLHFAYDPERGGPYGEAVAHLARPNPLWPAVEADPHVLLSVVDDYVFVPGAWQAPDGTPPGHGTPTSFYAAVQLVCTAHLVDDPQEKAGLLNLQLGHHEEEGATVPATPGQQPFGRLLPGIRGLRLEIRDVRAKFKYGAHKSEDVKERTAAGLLARGGVRDRAAHSHHLRHRTATAPADD